MSDFVGQLGDSRLVCPGVVGLIEKARRRLNRGRSSKQPTKRSATSEDNRSFGGADRYSSRRNKGHEHEASKSGDAVVEIDQTDRGLRSVLDPCLASEPDGPKAEVLAAASVENVSAELDPTNLDGQAQQQFNKSVVTVIFPTRGV